MTSKEDAVPTKPSVQSDGEVAGAA
jgi:hypothetical protein